jgi:hypothetical protein
MLHPLSAADTETAMKKRHENSLYDLLEQVAFEGYASVEKWRMARWYGQERFTVGIRRDVRERWSDLSADIASIEDKELMFAEVKGQIVLMHDQVFFDNNE